MAGNLADSLAGLKSGILQPVSRACAHSGSSTGVSECEARERQQKGRHRHNHTDAQKAPCPDMHAFAPQGDEPQDRRERSHYRQVGIAYSERVGRRDFCENASKCNPAQDSTDVIDNADDFVMAVGSRDARNVPP